MGATGPSSEAVARVFREGAGRTTAAWIRVFGDIDVAEDAVAEAFAIAWQTSPVEGLPANPGGWILTTARHKAIDRLRRESLGRALIADACERREESAEVSIFEPLDDDPLRLMFTCCHPALATEAQIALTLRLLGGLATHEVARAFLVEEATMAQRIVRAKRKIKAAHIPYRVPEGAEVAARLPPVLAVCYLIYNAGASRAPESSGEDLCAEGIRLARLLAELLPSEPEVIGLLSLLLLNESRRAARFAADGALVLLRDQERERWDRGRIEEGQAWLRQCLARNEPGPYQLQAAIQAVHADAASAEQTDWAQIIGIYDDLLRLTGTPVVALNRAIAVAEVRGPAAALELVEGLDLNAYYLFHATRGEFLRRIGRVSDAREAFARAAGMAPTAAERRSLRQRITPDAEV